jgi:hypothetical protein
MSLPLISLLFPTIYKLLFMAGISFFLFSYCRAVWKTLSKDWHQLQRLHQIPCHRCVFFTGEYNLKCTVHPSKALSEEAIGCRDYQGAKLY